MCFMTSKYLLCIWYNKYKTIYYMEISENLCWKQFTSTFPELIFTFDMQNFIRNVSAHFTAKVKCVPCNLLQEAPFR